MLCRSQVHTRYFFKKLFTNPKNLSPSSLSLDLPVMTKVKSLGDFVVSPISRAMKSQKEQTKGSYEEQQKATTDIEAGKTKTGKKRPSKQQKAKNIQMKTRL